MKIINAFYVVLLVMVFSFQSFAQKPPEVPLRDIFFDDGDFILREDAKPVLKENAEFLIMNPEINVVAVGFCNSDEYSSNYNLGEKRAETTKKFLIDLGVGPQRISLSSKCGSYIDIDGKSSELSEEVFRLETRVHFKMVKNNDQTLYMTTIDSGLDVIEKENQ